MVSTMSVANATSYRRERRAASAWRSVESLERSIAETRMVAATETDWEQLRIRSREIFKQLDRDSSASRQLAEVRQIRTELHQASDTLGLRALRLATAGSMMGWLHGEGTSAEARELSQLFAADQCLGIPGLADLEAELERARTLDR